MVEIFSSFGNITYCDMQMDKSKTWLNTGTAYVEFEKVEEVDEAIKKMDGGNKNNVWSGLLLIKSIDKNRELLYR